MPENAYVSLNPEAMLAILNELGLAKHFFPSGRYRLTSCSWTKEDTDEHIQEQVDLGFEALDGRPNQ